MKITITTQEDIIQSIKDLRSTYRITQKMLADGIGKSKSSIVRYELGHAHLSSATVVLIFQYFIKFHVKEKIEIIIKA